jgi:hypothetical protein
VYTDGRAVRSFMILSAHTSVDGFEFAKEMTVMTFCLYCS